MNIKEAISKVACFENLTERQTRDVFNEIMSGEATDAQIGAFLVAMRMKGETAVEIAGFAQVMREKATRIPTVIKDRVFQNVKAISCPMRSPANPPSSHSAAIRAAWPRITRAESQCRFGSCRNGSSVTLKKKIVI